MRSWRSQALLSAKLATPPCPAGAVVRARLHALLRGAVSRLTVVVAPAGWGKTTVLATWSHDAAEPRPVAWLSLDEADDEPVRFWTYVLTALATVAPRAAGEALETLSGQGPDPVGSAVSTLLNAVADTADRYVLVLDDYHVLTDPRIHQTVQFMLGYLPPALQVVIAARTDPPLPLARMRARGELTELRVADLCCTPDEAAALLTGRGVAATGSTAAPATEAPWTVTELLEWTEGWPAGLHLAALTLRERPGARADLAGGPERHIADYFTDEVLGDLDAATRTLLVRCSVLERLSGPLCDSVLGTTGSAAILDHLERADLFVTALDAQHQWYRCHRLFRDVLHRELRTGDPNAERTSLGRAADWHLAEGHVEDAVRLRISAGDDDGALALLNDRWFLDNGAFAALLHLGERLVARGAREPRLFVWLALAAALSSRPQHEARKWLDLAEPLITPEARAPTGWSSVRALADTVRAAYLTLDSLEDTHRYARRAVEQETDPAGWGWVYARLALAETEAHVGHPDAAVALLDQAWRAPGRLRMPTLLALQTAGELMYWLVTIGEHGRARQIGAEIADTATAVEQTWGHAWGAALSGIRIAEARMALAEHGPAAALPALNHLVQMVEREGGGRNSVILALAFQADALWATGEHAAARAALATAHARAETNSPGTEACARLAEVQARLGRRAATRARTHGGLADTITDRELALLRALQGPLCAREISTELHLSINTVKSHRRSLYHKLGVNTRTEAITRARELSLI